MAPSLCTMCSQAGTCCAADMLALYERCFSSSLGECNGKRCSRLCRRYYDGITILSAAERYFSMRIGGIDKRSPILSKP